MSITNLNYDADRAANIIRQSNEVDTMTARGELFIDEDCRDFFTKELDKEFGSKKWILDGTKYNEFYDESDLPYEISVPILSMEDDRQILGRADIRIQFEIAITDMGDKYVEATPKQIKIIRTPVVDEICMQCYPHHNRTVHNKAGCVMPGCNCKVVNFKAL